MSAGHGSMGGPPAQDMPDADADPYRIHHGTCPECGWVGMWSAVTWSCGGCGNTQYGTKVLGFMDDALLDPATWTQPNPTAAIGEIAAVIGWRVPRKRPPFTGDVPPTGSRWSERKRYPDHDPFPTMAVAHVGRSQRNDDGTYTDDPLDLANPPPVIMVWLALDAAPLSRVGIERAEFYQRFEREVGVSA